MDEEVQKWSRKDPSAIRKAMINPEHLESLERGELKYTCRSDDNYGDSSADTESEEASDVEIELEAEPDDIPEPDIEFLDMNHAADEDDEIGFDIEVSPVFMYNQQIPQFCSCYDRYTEQINKTMCRS